MSIYIFNNVDFFIKVNEIKDITPAQLDKALHDDFIARNPYKQFKPLKDFIPVIRGLNDPILYDNFTIKAQSKDTKDTDKLTKELNKIYAILIQLGHETPRFKKDDFKTVEEVISYYKAIQDYLQEKIVELSSILEIIYNKNK